MSAKDLKTNPLILFIIIVIMVMSASSCARRMTFTTSRIVPSAEGRVKIKKDKNDNYAIELKVRHLPDSKRLDPPRKTYIVWMETVRNGTRNIGNLNTSSGLFSKTLKSSLNTVSPYKPVSFFITAENTEGITYPNGEVVLRTE
jgi:hypothetical protein